jgi:hypothetical protein
MAKESITAKEKSGQVEDFIFTLPSVVGRLNLIGELGGLDLTFSSILESVLRDLAAMHKGLYPAEDLSS